MFDKSFMFFVHEGRTFAELYKLAAMKGVPFFDEVIGGMGVCLLRGKGEEYVGAKRVNRHHRARIQNWCLRHAAH